MRITEVVEFPLTDFFDSFLPGVDANEKRVSLLTRQIGERRFCIFDVRPETGFLGVFGAIFTGRRYSVEIRTARPDFADVKYSTRCAWSFYLRSSAGQAFTIDNEGRLRGFSFSSSPGNDFMAWIRRRADDPDRPKAESMLDTIISELASRGTSRL